MFEDPPGDVANSDGVHPPSPLPHLDLLSVRLDPLGNGVRVVYELASAIPTLGQRETALWVVYSEGYQLGAKRIGQEWDVYVFDLYAARNVNLSPTLLSVDGKRLTVLFPLSDAPRLTTASAWYAVTETEGRWGDRAPDD